MAGRRTGRSVSKCVLPDDRTGYHIVLATWKTSDTPATFYQVIDLLIGSERSVGYGSNPGSIGSLAPSPRDLAAGDTVKLRAFTALGEDAARSISLTIVDTQQGRSTVWPAALARAINKDKRLGYRVGASAIPNRDGGVDNLFVYADSDASVPVVRVESDVVQHPISLGVEVRDLLPEYAIDSDGTATIHARLSTRNVHKVSLRAIDSANGRVAQTIVEVGDGDSNATLRIDRAKPGNHDLLVVASGAGDYHQQQTYRFSLTAGTHGEFKPAGPWTPMQ